MGIIDRYIFRHTFIATVFVTLVLAVLVFLTQSLKFLDLVVNAGASGLMIWVQTFLYLPGFFEIILPIGMVAAILFIYNRLTMDSELVVLRSLGFSPLRLAKPAIQLSIFLGMVLFGVMGWVAPASRSEAVVIKQELKAKMSSLIFRDGIFNEAGKNVMVYIRDRDNQGNLHGLIIHDTRDKTKPAATIIAARGVLVSTPTGQQVLVYNGSRQDVDSQTGMLRRLDFDRYTVDLPEDVKTKEDRWKQPEERSFPELLSGLSPASKEDRTARRALRVELQKRVLLPFLVPAFAMVGLTLLLIGDHDRRGQGVRIMVAVAIIVLLEICFLGSYNIAKQSSAGLPLMLLTILLPFLLSLFAFLKDAVFMRRQPV